jgi:ABC-type branched-subunit amino acid transport system substrate-binding protein
MSWPRAALLGIVLVAGCPSRFDPRAEPLTATSNDPEARRAYREARERLDAGDFASARSRFHDFRAAHPEDPMAPGAALWEARAALGTGDGAAAIAIVEPMAKAREGDPVAERARFILGLSLARSESAADAARARELLRPFVAIIASGDDQVELHAALAEAALRLGDAPDALAEYGRFYEGARPAERVYIRMRTAALIEKLPADEAKAQRRRFGLEIEAAGGGIEVEKAAIGLALPLSGRNRLTGERALRGALLAAESIPAGSATLDLRVRDTESNPERAAQVVDELAKDGVVAVVGSPDRAEAQAQAARAEALGLPLLELAPDDAPRDKAGLVFKLVRPNPARAEALAARAVSLGAARIATLYPDNAYGKKMAEAFAERARAKGAKVVAEVPYDEKTTTFIAVAKKLVAEKPDAVFVPAAAVQLSLVASQLAASGVLVTQGGKGKGALLLATADGLSVKLLQSAGRYVQGAVLAPVFYADAADGRLGPFVEKFRGQYGEEPGAADALGYDAVQAVRGALGKIEKAEGRAELARRVAGGMEVGVTGVLGFAAGERGGTPQLYVVDGKAIRALR